MENEKLKRLSMPISQFKRNSPLEIELASSKGCSIAVTSHEEVMFYAVPVELYMQLTKHQSTETNKELA